MRAVAVRAFRASPELMELPEPTPGPGELGIRMEAAGVNPFDWKIADGILASRPHTFPLVLGVDGAGTVNAVGPGVDRFSIGDRLFGQFLADPVGRGTYAEQGVVPSTNALARIPAGLSAIDAAALPTAGMTAMEIRATLHLRPGERVVIVGASGGVGSFLVPLARAAGGTVVAIARPSSHERLRAIGASEVVDAAEDPIAAVRRSAPEGVDALVDFVSDATTFAQWAELVRDGGTAVSTVHVARPIPGRTSVNIDLQPRTDLSEGLGKEIAAGNLRVPVERTIPLDQAPEIVAEGRTGRLAGKTVIRLSPP